MTESLSHIVLYLSLSLIALAGVNHYSKYFPVPSVLWMLLLGVGYGALTQQYGHLPHLSFTPELVFFGFVPVLIFASSRQMCLHALRSILVPATLLATLGVVVSAVVIGLPTAWLLGINPWVGILFGLIMSATDPLAIGAVLHSAAGLSEERKLLIEGESLFNDGTVIALFGIMLAVFAQGAENFYFVELLGSAAFVVFSALAVGAVLGYAGRKLLFWWHESGYLYQMNLALAVAYLSFTIAEHYLHASGILAVFASALAFFYQNHKNDERMKPIWQYAEQLANAALFFLLGVAFMQHDFSLLTIALVVGTIILMFCGRMIGIAVTSLVLPKKYRLQTIDQIVLNLSGVRGAISIALILSLDSELAYREAFLCLGFIMVLASLSLYPVLLKHYLNRA